MNDQNSNCNGERIDMEHQWDSDERPSQQKSKVYQKMNGSATSIVNNNIANNNLASKNFAKNLKVIGVSFLLLTLFIGAVSVDAKPRRRSDSSSVRSSDRESRDESARASIPRDNQIVHFENLKEHDLLVDRFELTERTRIDISATVAAVGGNTLNAYVWILDAETREPVWTIEESDTERRRRSRVLRDVEDHTTLPAGKYEAYYYVGPRYSWGSTISIGDVEDLEDLFDELSDKLGDLGGELEASLNDLFDEDNRDSDYDRDDRDDDRDSRAARRKRWKDSGYKVFQFNEKSGLSRKELRSLELVISSDSKSFKKHTESVTHSELDIVNFTNVVDDQRFSQGFSLKKDMKIHISAQGEYSSSGNIFVDHGWIINAESGERVWEMDKWSTRYAGGAKKNRHAQDDLSLPAGNYVAFYMSDDSHAFDEWNAPPPFDPLNYGIRVSVKSASDKSSVGAYKYDPEKNMIFALDRVRNDEYVTQGFTLTKPTKLRILCYGEHAFNQFADYGWIEDVSTMDPVWEMTEDNTSYGGGATKNRVANEVITLPAGDYMAGYVTDDSHAYRSWNSDKPLDPDKWGITVYGVGEDFDKSSVNLFKEAPAGSGALVSLTRVGDDEEVSEDFTLTETTKVTISALGEGSGGRMYDYGWIENTDNGRIVWKMRYRKTRNAGGAEKNRMVTATVTLDPGTYEVIFVTDGSHSYQRFNARQPRNPQRWGIIVSAR